MDVARSKVDTAIKNYEELYSRKAIGLGAVEFDDANKVTRAIPLLLDWDDIRLKLTKRNRELTNLANRCVSSAIRPS